MGNNIVNYRLLTIFLIAASVIIQPLKVNTVENLNSHLHEYSYLDHTQHDNIDDTPASEHVHRHKHSEDGEEHEHHHEHTKISHSDVNMISHDSNYSVVPEALESVSGFYETSMVSDPHIKSLFRPPIV